MYPSFYWLFDFSDIIRTVLYPTCVRYATIMSGTVWLDEVSPMPDRQTKPLMLIIVQTPELPDRTD
jgi:hypothetical protein